MDKLLSELTRTGIGGCGRCSTAQQAAEYILAQDYTIKELMEALDELRRCSNAIVGADMQDENAEEAFTMFWKAQDTSRTALSRAKSLMEQKP